MSNKEELNEKAKEFCEENGHEFTDTDWGWNGEEEVQFEVVAHPQIHEAMADFVLKCQSENAEKIMEHLNHLGPGLDDVGADHYYEIVKILKGE